MNTIRRITTLALLAALVTLVACATPPEHEPTTIDRPVDAFNAVRHVHGPVPGQRANGLSTDIEHLKSAHQLYERAQRKRARRIKRQQQRCRQQSGSSKVPIQGDPGAVYCQSSSDHVETGNGD